MLQQTLEQLTAMKLPEMAQAIDEQLASTHYHDLSFEERLALIVETQWLAKFNNQVTSRIRRAALNPAHADLERLDFSTRKGITKDDIIQLRSNSWITHAHNLIITGPTGIGKTYLAAALGTHACRQGFQVSMIKTHELCGQLLLLRESKRSPKGKIAYILKSTLVILDEWLREPLPHTQARVLLDFIDNRYQQKSLILASQLDVAHWHERFSDPTIADAILDRLVHNAYRFQLKGEIFRKKYAPKELKKTDTKNSRT